MKLRNITNTFKKLVKFAIMLPVMFTTVNAFAGPTITPQEFKEGYRLTHCLAENVTTLTCDYKDMNVFDYVKYRFGITAEVVEVGVGFTGNRNYSELIIKFKVN